MDTRYENIPLLRNEITRQFEIVVDGKKSLIEFELREGKMFLTHTEVPPSQRELGIGEALVEKTFEYLEENKLPLVPTCPFIAAYIRKHPSWRRILAKGIQVGSRERF